MSNKIKKILNKNKIDLNMNNDYYEEDELNYLENDEENKNISYDDNNNLEEENENQDEKEKNSLNVKNINDKEINDLIVSNNLDEEGYLQNNIQDEDLPLITLNFISICQCCKNKFDSKKNLPYLLKCGHFFCINCIKQYFTDETGVVCPTDGLIAKSIKDLKLLKNLIIDSKKSSNNNSKKKKNIDEEFDSLNIKTKNNNDSNLLGNYCNIHKNQKLSHIVDSTNEIICVHCAFERLKSNPNLEIKEIKEKFNEYNENVESIINNSQKNIELIQHTLELISKNKENEEKKLNVFYNNIIKFIENQKKERIKQIENIFKENTHDLEQKLLIFTQIIEQSGELKKLLGKEDENISQNYSKISNNYNNILKLNKSSKDESINNKLKYIRFSNENEINIKEYLSKISNLNIIYRVIKYIKNGKNSLKENNLNNIKKIENQDEENNPPIRYKKIISNNKNTFNNNIKNISSQNIYENNINNNRNGFINKNSSMAIKENNYFNPNNYSKLNNFRKTNNSTKNSNIVNKTPTLKNQYEDLTSNKRPIRTNASHLNNNSLLESYFELKNKEKYLSLNNYENSNLIDRRFESQKNSKSFNNLNLLNNFYNLESTKKTPFNNKKKSILTRFHSNKNYDTNKVNKIKLYNETFNSLLPQHLDQFNKLFNFQ